MTGLALLVLGLALLIAAAHPFASYPMSLRLLAAFRAKPWHRAAPPPGCRAALCVCFYNEAPVARARIENMLAAQAEWPGLELLAYVDGASDATADILHAYADRIRLIVSPQRLGKTAGMNRLVALTSVEYLVFSDANVAFAAGAIPALLRNFASPEIGCVCGQLRHTSGLDRVATDLGSHYWRLEERIKALESATGSVMGADGAIFAIRRALHRAPPPDLIDDFYVSLCILCQGARVVRDAEAIAYEPAVDNPGQELVRKRRIACQAFNVHRALRHDLFRLGALDLYKYVSHKLLRWFCFPLLLAASLCLFAALGVLAGANALMAVALATALVAIGVVRTETGPATQLKNFVAALFATAQGVWRSMRGDRYQTWTPPASARGIFPPSAMAEGDG